MSLAAMYSYRCDVLDRKVTRLEAERAEVEYRKTTHNGPLRRALLETDDGWRLSNVARVADHAGSLRYYHDGWEFGDKTYETREDAERNLAANGWEKWTP